MLEAGKLITAKEAERRVLVLENPGLRGQSQASPPRSMPACRWSSRTRWLPPTATRSRRCASCWRARGAYTAVDGERTLMRPGDFIITPYMAWHDHGNESDEPMFWLDGLDIPLIQFLDASFLERLDEDEQPIGKPEGYSMARYGANLLPVDHNGRQSATSPIFNYPYDRTREALHQLAKAQQPDACHGIKMRYSNPVTGDHAMPTMGTFIQLLPKGFHTARYRSTDAGIFVAIEGRGRTRVGDTVLEWGPKDIFVVPSWKPVVTRGRRGERAVQLLRPPRAGEDRRLARGPRQRVTFSPVIPACGIAPRRDPAEPGSFTSTLARSRIVSPGVARLPG